MQLPEGAGEGGFTALVRAGYDKDALLAFQLKIIADDRGVFTNKFIGEGDIAWLHNRVCLERVLSPPFFSRSVVQRPSNSRPKRAAAPRTSGRYSQRS